MKERPQISNEVIEVLTRCERTVFPSAMKEGYRSDKKSDQRPKPTRLVTYPVSRPRHGAFEVSREPTPVKTV